MTAAGLPPRCDPPAGLWGPAPCSTGSGGLGGPALPVQGAPVAPRLRVLGDAPALPVPPPPPQGPVKHGQCRISSWEEGARRGLAQPPCWLTPSGQHPLCLVRPPMDQLLSVLSTTLQAFTWFPSQPPSGHNKTAQASGSAVGRKGRTNPSMRPSLHIQRSSRRVPPGGLSPHGFPTPCGKQPLPLAPRQSPERGPLAKHRALRVSSSLCPQAQPWTRTGTELAARRVLAKVSTDSALCPQG